MADYEGFFINKLSDYFVTDIKGSGIQKRATCPFCGHKEDFSFRTDTGQCKCFQCGFEGDAFKFLKELEKKSFKEAKEELSKWGIKPLQETKDIDKKINIKNEISEEINTSNHIDIEDEVKKYVSNLTEEDVVFLKEKRGLTDEVIEKYKIGIANTHPEYGGEKRLTIPIMKDGKFVNIRYHSLNKAKYKDLPFKNGMLYATYLFPEENLENDVIWLCEGELDALCAISHGLNAITVTGGAGSWKSDFTPLFKNKTVYIIYDCDNAGRTGADKIAKILCDVARVKIIDLKLSNQEDITDWFVKYKKTKKELNDLAHIIRSNTFRTVKLYRKYYSVIDEARQLNKKSFKEQVQDRSLNYDHFLLLGLLDVIGDQALEKAIERAERYREGVR